MVAKKKEKKKINLCQLTSLLYLLPLVLILYQEMNHSLAICFLLLTIFAFVNHSRPYTSYIHKDWIDSMDRIFIIIIVSYFMFHYFDTITLWSALLYMLVAYFFVIPKCKKLKTKIKVHCSFHVITSLASLILLMTKN